MLAILLHNVINQTFQFRFRLDKFNVVVGEEAGMFVGDFWRSDRKPFDWLLSDELVVYCITVAVEKILYRLRLKKQFFRILFPDQKVG